MSCRLIVLKAVSTPWRDEDGSGDDDQSDVDADGSDKDEPADEEDDFLDTTTEEQDAHFDDKLLHSAGGPWDQQDEENISSTREDSPLREKKQAV